MKTRIVAIGNSQGVRIPKVLLEEAGLPEDVELRVEGGRIVIEPADQPRTGWAQAAARLAREEKAESATAGEFPASDFDETEWEWT